MKTKLLTLIAILISAIGLACPVCEANQPKGFENLTHGKGPEGDFDFIIMFVAIIIVGYALIMSIKYLAKPKEKEKSHIKNIVLDDYNLLD